ncbi:DUF433 domain-containing protein [Geminocystis herdmanii]|uniref:DUF433 domain-containing protein n=1 Tax=Geminocystis herdmanii TaxID=669359 RepID=UPI00034535A7|nr:DUF433 domain-containing protein [Geminocystis herdmanii]
MLLESFFDIYSENDIRLKGTRIGIETILYEYIYNRKNAEEISNLYTQVSLEDIYSTILYYLHNKVKITEYMIDWLKSSENLAKQQDKNPTVNIIRLKNLKNQTKISA